MLPPANYDSGLYHLNAIRWLNTYSIVPGLGNLHGRLAYKVVNEANWIYSWAKQPGIHWSKVLGSWEWFGPWRLRLGSYPVEVIYPLAVSAAFCIIALIIGRLSFSRSGRRPRYWEWSILLPSIIGLVYWFFTDPDPRFAHALFWLLTLSSALLLLSTLRKAGVGLGYLHGLRRRQSLFCCIRCYFSPRNHVRLHIRMASGQDSPFDPEDDILRPGGLHARKR